MNLHDELLQQELDDTLAGEFRKRGQTRCQARIPQESVALRSHGSPTDRRCRRSAVQQEGEWWFCRQHAPIWRIHNEIVDRILAIPVRRD